MKYFIIFLLLILVFCDAKKLTWNLSQGSALDIDLVGYVTVETNGFYQKHWWEKNNIKLKVFKEVSNKFGLKGIFKVLEGSPFSPSKLIQTKESSFFIDKRGRFYVEEETEQPNVRSVPSFPNQAVEEGSTWQAPLQIHYSKTTPKLTIQGMANYRYKKTIEKNNKQVAIIGYEYQLSEEVGNQLKIKHPFGIKKILITCEGTIEWDLDQGVPLYELRYYHQTYLKDDDQVESIVMQSTATYQVTVPITDKQMQQTLKDVSKAFTLNASAKKQVESLYDKKGILFRLKNILFDHDDYKLNKKTYKVLEDLVPILLKYKHYQISVIGHTDGEGGDDYNQRLSTKRALSVVQAIDKISGGKLRIYYEGLGESVPLASNDTVEGREKNRRVEIRINRD